MIRKKSTLAKLFSLLVAVILCLTVFVVPVSAEGSDDSQDQENGKTKLMYLEKVDTDEEEPEVVVPIFEDGLWNKVHSNPGTFEKNYKLSPELKEYAITTYEDVVSEVLDPEMSDLEKYYTLAIWLNRYVSYDWNLWSGGYDFDYYTHQWDAYGVLKERKSVCAGIAIAYANLCHAADLPCKFVRMDPFYLDHTINYIPNINGYSYYIDVTEDLFFFSKKSNPWNPLDTEFSYIPSTKLPKNGSFEYSVGKNSYLPSRIKPFYDVPFEKWYKEYALHKNTKKKFKTKYVEKGSGKWGTHYASYKDYPKQFSATEKPGIWFIEDFYKDPETISSKIINKELDGQLLDISGVKESYDYDNVEDLVAAVSNDIAISYFPSTDENDQIVAKTVELTKGEEGDNGDYTVSCTDFDLTAGEATITITGTGEYSGEYEIPVKLYSAYAAEAPVNKMDLVYTGEQQELVKPGTEGAGTILYAFYNKVSEDESWKKGDPDAEPYPEPDLIYSEEIPKETNAGRYAVWYMVEGDDTHTDMQPQRLKGVAIIAPLSPKILVDDITIKVGERFKLEPTLDMEKDVVFDYFSYEPKTATVSVEGVVKGVRVGTTKVSVGGLLQDENPNYDDPQSVAISVKVNKGDNTLNIKAKTTTVKRSKLKKKNQKLKVTRVVKFVKKGQGKKSYRLVSVKKGKKSFKKKFSINKKTGKLTVKKGLKKGTYKVTIKVRALGNSNYNKSSWQTVTSKVRVK